MDNYRRMIAVLMVLLLMLSVMPRRAFAGTTEGSYSEVTETKGGTDEEEYSSDVPEAVKRPGDDVPDAFTEKKTDEDIKHDEAENSSRGDDIPEEKKEDADEREMLQEMQDREDDGTGTADPTGKDNEEDDKETYEGSKEEDEGYELTLLLTDVKNDIKVYRNGIRAVWIYGSSFGGDGNFYIAGEKGPEKLEKGSDGMTKVVLEAEKGDVFVIETARPEYAAVTITNGAEQRIYDAGKSCSFTVEISENTWFIIDADYSKADGWYQIPERKHAELRSDPSSPVLPDEIYVELGSRYDDYTASAMINGHTGVWYFQADSPEGMFVSAACGNTSKTMVTGIHYKVARIAETAAREYLDWGEGCCSERTQRALAWITHHGLAEYDWRAANEGISLMGNGTISVSSHLEAYTITFLASWVCTNDGREGAYGTVDAEKGAAALDALFGSEFSAGLPDYTKNKIDAMVSMGLAFAEKHTDPDDLSIDEYADTYVYSDGNSVHQPLLIGAYRGHAKGSVRIRKVSEASSITEGNVCYSLEGTSFRVTDSSGTEAGILKCDASGNTEELELDPGTYTVTEISAGEGYIRDDSVETVEITSYETAEVTFSNSPVTDPAGIHLAKWDRETDSFVPQGAGTFQGAEYRIEYFDNYTWSGEPLRSWVFRTDGNGSIRYLPSYKVSGPDLYTYGGGYVFPLGSIRITETKAPEGYLMSADILYATIEQDGDTAKFRWTSETLGLIKENPDGTGLPESAVRGGVSIRKADAETGQSVPQGEGTLEGAEYTVYAAEEIIIDGKQYSAGEEVLTLITEEYGTAATGNRDLPYGSYYIKETNSPEGYLPDDTRKDFRIEADSVIVDLTSDKDVSLEAPIKGGIRIRKADAETGRSLPQGDAKLAGAEYTVYAANEMNIAGKHYAAGETVLTIVTDENGVAETAERALPYGSYLIKETNAPEGYLIDETERTFRIENDGDIADLTSDKDASFENVIRGQARFRKVDRQTGSGAQGSGTLEGAKITIYNASAGSVLIDGNDIAPGEPVCIIYTKTDGFAATDERILAYGTYTAIETSPSAGYLLNEDWSVTFSIREDGQTADLTAEDTVLREQVIRGDLILLKLDVDGKPMANIPFMIEALDKEGNVIERHVMVTGEDGRLDTASVRNTNRTNSLDVYTDGSVFTDSSMLDPSVGIWFGGGEPDDDLGALPYGAYKVYELQTEDTAGMQMNLLESGIEVLDSDHLVIDFGAMVDLSAELESDASWTDSGLDIIPEAEEVRVTDRVRYRNLTAGRKYTLETRFVLRSDILKEVGSASADFTPGPGRYGKTTSDGYIDVQAVLDTAGLSGQTVVAFDRLYEYVDGKKVLIAVHEDPDDGRQMLRIPAISTMASDVMTGDHVGTVSEDAWIRDIVIYMNLRKGETFILRAVLADPETGEPVRDKDGNIYAAEKEFVCGREKGIIKMPDIKMDSTELEGGSAVVQEELYLIRDGEEIKMCSHEDLSDKDQTVTYPEIRTKASGRTTGDHTEPVSEHTVTEDRVMLTGLVPGEQYRVTGKLVCKLEHISPLGETNETGHVISEAAMEFIAEAEEQEIVLWFDADITESGCVYAVVFEYLEHDGVTVASHEDPDDAEQQMCFPEILTKAHDLATGTQFVSKGRYTVLRDKVQIRGLIPGNTYAVKGYLADMYSGDVLAIPQRSTVFTADGPEAEVYVDIFMDTDKVSAFTGVFFEELYLVKDGVNEILLAEHKSLDDEDQTLYLPWIGTTATEAENGRKEVQGTEKTVIKDTVVYRDLRPLEEYELQAVLMNARTGRPVRVNGKTVAATTELSPEYPDGEAEMFLEFDAGELGGDTVVVFERLMYNGTVIASHEDLVDKGQSVNIISLETSARDSVNGTQEMSVDSGASIIDTVRYRGLTPGKTYTLRGVLMNRYGGEPVIQHGQKITAETEFVPDSPDGEVEMMFFPDTVMLQGQELVVFERLYDGASDEKPESLYEPIAVHEDLEDEEQTVSVPILPEEPVNTGDEGNGKDWMLAAASGAGLVWVMTDGIRRNRREKKRHLERLKKTSEMIK